MSPTTAPQPSPSPASPLLGPLVGLLGLLVAALGFGQGFVWDDWPLLVQNPSLHAPSPWWQPLVEPFQGRGKDAIGHYRPLASMLGRLGLELTPGSPLGTKALSAGLHGLNAWLLWVLLRRIGRQLGSPRPAFWAFVGAALFACAPLQLEALWWASALAVPLHLLPLLLAFLFSGGPFGSDTRPNGSAWLAGLMLLIALLSKDNAVTFPAFLVGAHFLLGTRGARLKQLTLASLVALMAWLALRANAFGSLDMGLGRAIVDADLDGVRRITLALELILGGMGHALVPFWPELLRPVSPQLHVDLRWLPLGVGLLGLVGLCRAVWLRRQPWAAVLLLGLGLHLLPIGVYPELLGRYPLSDRQLYVPLALTGALLAGWSAGIEARRPRVGRGLTGILVAGLCFGLSIDIRRMPVWQDDVALFSAATKANPHSAFGWNALGRAALERFRSVGLDADLKLAQDAYQTTLDLALGAARQRLSALGFALPNAGPDEPKERELDWIASVDLIEANLGLSWCLLHEAELDSYRDFAVPQALFERVLRAAPESSDAHAGLAIALYLQGDLPGARENLRQALALAPDSAALHRQAARLAHAASDFDTARRHAERAIALDPASAEGFLWLARAELELGHLEQARRAAQTASERAPESSAPVVLLGMVAGQEGSLEAALGQFDAALKLDPDDAQAHAQRGKALLGLRQVEAALFAWRTAVELDDSLFEPQYNLASELLRLGQASAAQPHLRQAYAHCPSAELRTLMRGTLSNLAKNDATSLRTLASVDRRRDLESAVEWARLATLAEPKTAANWELYGSLLTNAARPLDALQAFEQAAQHGASGFLFERARAFAMADAALPEAEAALKRVLTLMPNETQLDPSVLASWREEIEARLKALPQGPAVPR